MTRKALESAAANYPYLQGLWVLPMGFMLLITGVSNLEPGLPERVMLGILGSGLVVSALAYWRISHYYRDTYGAVTPTRARQTRYAVALVTWIAVLFVGANRFLFWSADSPRSVYAAAFALATLAYYAILVGLRAHHVVIWGAVLVAGLLPIWGGLGANRDAIAMFPLGIALIASGLFDQRLLARSFGSSASLDHEDLHVGG